MKPEMKEHTNVLNDAKRIIFLLPRVSDIKPQKCALNIIPTNGIDVKSPNSLVVKCKSQFAYGNIKLTLTFSSMPLNTTDADNRKVIK